MLASHNTMTYLKPTKWWMYLIQFTSRCQRKTIDEQIAAGVVYVDIRIAYNADTSRWEYAHGLMRYRSDIEIESLLIQLAKQHVRCRIVNEDGEYIPEFRRLISKALDIDFMRECIHYAVEDKHNWIIYRRGAKEQRKVIDNYPTYPHDGVIPYPWRDNHIYTPRDPSYVESPEYIYLCDFI